VNILIDIGHPAHVHLFRPFAHCMINKGHQVLFTVREKECEIRLLDKEGFSYINLGRHYQSGIGKVFGLIRFTIQLIFASIKFKPDIYLSHGSMYTAFASVLLRKPNIALEDTGNPEQVKLYLPFTPAVITSTCFRLDYGDKQVRYNGYHELAYLHPKHFKADISVLEELGVKPDDKYFILRFVSWDASHDTGHKGVTDANKSGLINELSKYGKVFISSQKPLSTDLEPYCIPVQPHRMHDAIAFAWFLYGESATMASEAAMLGVPAIYLDDTGRFYTTELEEKFGLVFNFSESEDDQGKSILKAIELAKADNIRQEWANRQKKMLSEKIDVTTFLCWFIEEWPESFRRVKENPDYPDNFK
jgi:uncharacterized protein